MDIGTRGAASFKPSGAFSFVYIQYGVVFDSITEPLIIWCQSIVFQRFPVCRRYNVNNRICSVFGLVINLNRHYNGCSVIVFHSNRNNITIGVIALENH